MDDYLTRVAEAVRDATLNKAWQIGNNGPLRSAVDLQAVIASVPRPETVAAQLVMQDGDKSTCSCGPVRHWECNAGCKAKHSAEAVAAQVAVPVIPAEKFPPLDRSWSANTEHIAGWNDCRNTMLAAAPEAPQPVLDRPASIGGTTFGVGIPVRTLVAAAQRRYEAEQTPASQAERQALIDALRCPVVDAELTTLREQNAALVAAVEATLFHVNNNTATINSSVVCELYDALAIAEGGAA
ncbi:hypothetical protein [Microvirgula aerodenitrificans]|uniref:hypothetical protein n=1 Tax=Microvirgula aerodenitrificans TaxID=57480 RepID=UPI00248E1F30|nr:hypothetical protein [Microvirgula aerodenitrificans]